MSDDDRPPAATVGAAVLSYRGSGYVFRLVLGGIGVLALFSWDSRPFGEAGARRIVASTPSPGTSSPDALVPTP